MSNNNSNVDDLFESAQDDDILSSASMASIGAIHDYGAQIQNSLGVNVADVNSEEVVLVGGLIDDSSSIQMDNNTQIVIDGWNACINALLDSKQEKNIYSHIATLNSGIIHPFMCLVNNQGKQLSPPLDTNNYKPHGGTPLYERAVVFLGTMLAKAQEFADNGIPCRTVTLIVTDGANNGGSRASDVANLAKDLFRQETHIVAGLGIDDGYTDFDQIFKDMGIPKQWILTPKNDASSIRQAFQVFSRSAVRASQSSAAAFSKAKVGGFGD